MDIGETINQLQLLLESSEFEEIHEAAANSVAFLTVAQAALDQEDGEVLEEEEVDDAVAEGIEDLASSLYQIFEIDVEEARMTDQDAMMMANRNMSGMASFSQGFGQVLAGIVTERFQNVHDGISLISEITGLDNDEVSGLFDGSITLEPNDAAELADALNLEQSDYNQFVNLAVSAYNEVAGGETLEVGSSITAQPVAAMSADTQLRAEFEALKEREAIGETLRSVERLCDQLVANGNLTTHERRLLIGDFETNQDRVAQFSQACNHLQVPPGQQLDRIQYYLYVAQNRPSIAMFGQLVEEPLESQPFSNDDVNAVNSFRDRYGFR